MINRCVCRNIRFEEILSLSQGERDFEAVLRAVQFGDKCKMCHPYVKKMLITGETFFTKIEKPSIISRE